MLTMRGNGAIFFSHLTDSEELGKKPRKKLKGFVSDCSCVSILDRSN
jgi:hypothetical protein